MNKRLFLLGFLAVATTGFVACDDDDDSVNNDVKESADISPVTDTSEISVKDTSESPITDTSAAGVKWSLAEELTASEVADYVIPEDSEPPIVFVQASNGSSQKYVDMGLPSGTLWADRNLGASSIYGVGDYYALGENFTKESFSTGNYQWYSNGQYTKYNSDGTKVSADDDPSYDCSEFPLRHTPSTAEWKELIENSDVVYFEAGNSVCVKITSKINGNYIVLPCDGIKNGSSVRTDYYFSTVTRKMFYYRCSDMPEGTSTHVGCYNFVYFVQNTSCNGVVISSGENYCGMSVRPVKYPDNYEGTADQMVTYFDLTQNVSCDGTLFDDIATLTPQCAKVTFDGTSVTSIRIRFDIVYTDGKTSNWYLNLNSPDATASFTASEGSVECASFKSASFDKKRDLTNLKLSYSYDTDGKRCSFRLTNGADLYCNIESN